jgi:hypothetical protein
MQRGTCFTKGAKGYADLHSGQLHNRYVPRLNAQRKRFGVLPFNRQIDENLQHMHGLADFGRNLVMHDSATGSRPVETAWLNVVTVPQRIPVINPGFRVEKQVGHR